MLESSLSLIEIWLNQMLIVYEVGCLVIQLLATTQSFWISVTILPKLVFMPFRQLVWGKKIFVA